MLKELTNIDLFKGIPKEYLDGLEADCSRITLNKGDYLFRQGDIGIGMYVIIDGELEIIVDGNEKNAVATLGNGTTIGEISLLTKQVRNASARAKSTATLLFLDIKKFSEQIEANDLTALRICYNISLTMAERLEKVNHLLTALQNKDHSLTVSEISKYKEQLLGEGLF